MPIKRLTVYECSDSSRWSDFEKAKAREALLKKKNAILQKLLEQAIDKTKVEDLG